MTLVMHCPRCGRPMDYVEDMQEISQKGSTMSVCDSFVCNFCEDVHLCVVDTYELTDR